MGKFKGKKIVSCSKSPPSLSIKSVKILKTHSHNLRTLPDPLSVQFNLRWWWMQTCFADEILTGFQLHSSLIYGPNPLIGLRSPSSICFDFHSSRLWFNQIFPQSWITTEFQTRNAIQLLARSLSSPFSRAFYCRPRDPHKPPFMFWFLKIKFLCCIFASASMACEGIPIYSLYHALTLIPDYSSAAQRHTREKRELFLFWGWRITRIDSVFTLREGGGGGLGGRALIVRRL